jgi:hypothetical protein
MPSGRRLSFGRPSPDPAGQLRALRRDCAELCRERVKPLRDSCADLDQGALAGIGRRSPPAASTAAPSLPKARVLTIRESFVSCLRYQRGTSAYSDLMPVVRLAGLEVAVSPLLQWVAVPALALACARRGAATAERCEEARS